MPALVAKKVKKVARERPQGFQKAYFKLSEMGTSPPMVEGLPSKHMQISVTQKYFG